jgi:hypothetical protein
MAAAREREPVKPVERAKTCPHLIRIFHQKGAHHSYVEADQCVLLFFPLTREAGLHLCVAYECVCVCVCVCVCACVCVCMCVCIEQPSTSATDFDDGKVPASEVALHTWSDLSFAELFDILKIELAQDKQRDVKLSVRLVYPKKDGRYAMTDLAELTSYRSAVFGKQLHQKGFEVGDYLDVAIL